MTCFSVYSLLFMLQVAQEIIMSSQITVDLNTLSLSLMQWYFSVITNVLYNHVVTSSYCILVSYEIVCYKPVCSREMHTFVVEMLLPHKRQQLIPIGIGTDHYPHSLGMMINEFLTCRKKCIHCFKLSLLSILCGEDHTQNLFRDLSLV